MPPLRVADLGCGDGYLTIEIAGWARDVVAIDHSKRVLARAGAVARRRGVSNITWKHGEIEALPIDDATVDLALLSQTLHHATDQELVVREATRIVTDGGRVLVLDLAPHDQDWVKKRLGDRWLSGPSWMGDDERRRVGRRRGAHRHRSSAVRRHRGRRDEAAALGCAIHPALAQFTVAVARPAVRVVGI